MRKKQYQPVQEIRQFLETGPRITRAAVEAEMQKHEYFQKMDFQVHFGDFFCNILPSDDPLLTSIEFTIQIWHQGPFNQQQWEQEINKVYQGLVQEYGSVVAGEQPVARPQWH